MKNESTSFGTASLVCGIIGMVLWIMPYIAIVLSILAIVFYSKQKKIKPIGRSTTGLVLGIVGVSINAVILFFMAILIALVPDLLG